MYQRILAQVNPYSMQTSNDLLCTVISIVFSCSPYPYRLLTLQVYWVLWWSTNTGSSSKVSDWLELATVMPSLIHSIVVTSKSVEHMIDTVLLTVSGIWMERIWRPEGTIQSLHKSCTVITRKWDINTIKPRLTVEMNASHGHLNERMPSTSLRGNFMFTLRVFSNWMSVSHEVHISSKAWQPQIVLILQHSAGTQKVDPIQCMSSSYRGWNIWTLNMSVVHFGQVVTLCTMSIIAQE